MLREEKKNRIIKNAQNWREWGKSGRLKKKTGQWIENNKYIYINLTTAIIVLIINTLNN